MLTDWLSEHQIDDVAAIRATHLRAYLVDIAGRGLAASTVHHHAAAARTLFRWLEAEGQLAVSPMLRVVMPRVDKRVPEAFTAGEITALLKACSHRRDTAILLCLLDTGCRAAEFCALRIYNVDTTTGRVDVVAGKGGKGRTVYLGLAARKALRRYLTTCSPGANMPLWRHYYGDKALTVKGLQHLLRVLGERANVPHCHPHTFRRTFALWSLRSGMNIYALQQLMGHADLAMLRQYLPLVESDLAAAHQAHAPGDGL